MIAALTNFIFLYPWALAALLALPLLYLLLRVTPPPPRVIDFPPVRFLADLPTAQKTSSSTPWWMLLLRLLVAALIILALAHPVYNPAKILNMNGPIRIVIDNGWASAQNWPKIKAKADEILSQAERTSQTVSLLTTAPQPGKDSPLSTGPISSREARNLIEALSPHPWPADYAAALTALDGTDSDAVVQEETGGATGTLQQRPSINFFLSSGLQDSGFRQFLDRLEKEAPTQIYLPASGNLPIALMNIKNTGETLNYTLKTTGRAETDQTVSLQVLGDNGSVLDTHRILLPAGEKTVTGTIEIPALYQRRLTAFRLRGYQSAGAAFLTGGEFQKKTIGIVNVGDGGEHAPLIETGYYLRRALDPYAFLTSGNFEEVLDQNPAMIILPDIGTIPVETLNRLQDWVNGGGLLLRFAGPNMGDANAGADLLPIELTYGEGRNLAGSLSWEEPLSLAEFEEDSPFYGLNIPPEITVKQQILAKPSPDLADKIWATLEDGTPLITAAPQGGGLLVFIHTTATPDWSDLALSGLFVDILRRLADLAGQNEFQSSTLNGTLNPVRILDGFGAPQSPPLTAQPIEAKEIDTIRISSRHPPGIYGRAGLQSALNLFHNRKDMRLISIGQLPVSVSKDHYASSYEIDFKPYLFFAAALLFFMDWIITIALTSAKRPGYSPFKKFSLHLLFIFIMGTIMGAGLAPNILHAQTAPAATTLSSKSEAEANAFAMKHAEGLYLAYIETGDLTVDQTSRQGLEMLSRILAARTSVEPDGVTGVRPGRDNLAFFPLLYWPVTNQSQPLSPEATQQIQQYLDHGGTILFDTRDAGQTGGGGTFNRTQMSSALQSMLGSLNIPPLEPMQDDHVLHKTFYLLDRFPGLYDDGILWCEKDTQNGRDGVSSVLIGSHNWAAAWASLAGTGNNTLRGKTRDQELSFRFGVNLMMYALTGNYKADQVHVPAILERLDP